MAIRAPTAEPEATRAVENGADDATCAGEATSAGDAPRMDVAPRVDAKVAMLLQSTGGPAAVVLALSVAVTWIVDRRVAVLLQHAQDLCFAFERSLSRTAAAPPRRRRHRPPAQSCRAPRPPPAGAAALGEAPLRPLQRSIPWPETPRTRLGGLLRRRECGRATLPRGSGTRPDRRAAPRSVARPPASRADGRRRCHPRRLAPGAKMLRCLGAPTSPSVGSSNDLSSDLQLRPLASSRRALASSSTPHTRD
mmetsp:Transcript_150501/g.483827  ORF Transcript_150501/g.483827 Transcript_150501/m.483827 type:complete len:251 (-) Transcript_150501:2588-3340(-)